MKKIIITYMAVLLIFCSGCGKKDSAMPEETGTLSVREGEAFARSLEDSVGKGETATFARSMDWGALTDRILKDIPERRGEPKYKREAVFEAISSSGGIVSSIADKVKRGGSFQFVRMKESPLRAMFRLVDPEGGVDYLDLHLERGAGKTVQIYEIYLHHFGETLTNGLRKTFVPELYVNGKNSYGVMMTDLVRILFQEYHEVIQNLFVAAAEGKHQKVLDIYDTLPRELQENKSLGVMRLQAARQLDPQTYAFVTADLREKLKGDTCVEFLSLDYFFNHGQFDEALECLDRIDRLVGGDSYLNVFRSMAWLRKEEPEKARQLLQAALRENPEFSKDLTFQAMQKRLTRPVNPPAEN